MKIVITGANSFIGRKLAVKAAEQGWEIILVIRQGRTPPDIDAQVLYLDMQDYDRIGTLTGPCDCFVHLAWNGTRGESRMDEVRQMKNAQWSLSAVQSVLREGCGRIILAGSQAEYGPHMGQISEESECRPNTEYGKAKLDLYQKTLLLCKKAGAELVEPRFFSLYGPGDYAGTMTMSILRDMLLGHPCRLTKGIQNWDYLYIDDAIEALTHLCENTYPGGVYNFGSGDVRTLRDYVLEMAEITGSKSQLQFGAIPYPETGAVSLWPNVSKLQHTLGWVPCVSFGEGIRHILKEIEHGA